MALMDDYYEALTERLDGEDTRLTEMYVDGTLCFHALGDMVVILHNLKAGRISLDDVDLSAVPADFLDNQTRASRGDAEGGDVDGRYLASMDFVARTISEIAPRQAGRSGKAKAAQPVKQTV